MKPVSLIDPNAALRSDRSGWPTHLLSCDGLSTDAIEQLFTTAREMRQVGRRRVKKLPTLRGRTIINAFFENSTRTRANILPSISSLGRNDKPPTSTNPHPQDSDVPTSNHLPPSKTEIEALGAVDDSWIRPTTG